MVSPTPPILCTLALSSSNSSSCCLHTQIYGIHDQTKNNRVMIRLPDVSETLRTFNLLFTQQINKMEIYLPHKRFKLLSIHDCPLHGKISTRIEYHGQGEDCRRKREKRSILYEERLSI